MESNWRGNRLSLTLNGESHGDKIGAVLDGLPAEFSVDFTALETFMARRSPGRNPWSSSRCEKDEVRVLSGVDGGGRTSGESLAVEIANQDVQNTDYDVMRSIPRPGHADYSARIRFGENIDLRGGGHFSGRLTAPLCAVGAVALQMLKSRGIVIGAHIAEIAGIADASLCYENLTDEGILAPGKKDFPVVNDGAGEQMKTAILAAQADGDSVGGLIEAVALHLPAGLGTPWFDGVENQISRLLFAIPAVRGVEFGAGFSAAKLRGSQHNDAFVYEADGNVVTRTNRAGGVLGGITTGMPLVVRLCIKPTPSIQRAQDSIDLETGEPVHICVPGRHDPCIVPRAVPVVEAMMAIAILDMVLDAEMRRK